MVEIKRSKKIENCQKIKKITKKPKPANDTSPAVEKI